MTKKTTALATSALTTSALLLALFISTSASAEFIGPGSAPSTVTVKSISDMDDETIVTLEGYIVKKTKPEHYLFKDETDKINVEIDDADFRGIKVTPKTKIRITGEIDKDWTSFYIEVDHLELVNQE